MNTFETRFEEEEFEEVESPFAKQQTSSARRNTKNDQWRQPNIFSRPIGTVSTAAPTVVERPSSNRRSPTGPTEQIEMVTRNRQITAPQVDYLDDEMEEEEEEVATKYRTRAVVTRKTKKQSFGLIKLGWAIISLLALRLVFMERGVVDYFRTQGSITEREQELERVRDENTGLRQEIQRISYDKSYQRQMVKESLGVIAADEFLILFAEDSSETSTPVDPQL